MSKEKIPLILVLNIIIGIVFGIGVYTFVYGEGFAYLSKEPKVCKNCHIMNNQYDSWLKSGHHHVAGCIDCHLPTQFPESVIAKLRNGYYHSKGFTFQDFEEPIQIKEKNREVLIENCFRCHKGLFMGSFREGNGIKPDCLHCHSMVGHGQRAGLGSPYTNKVVRHED